MNGANEVLILPKAIVTSLASEFAVKRGITITRISNFSSINGF